MLGEERYHAALLSARDLHDKLDTLTEEDLRGALEFESASRRRSAIIERLIQRLVSVVETRTRNELIERYAPWLGNAP